MSEVFSCADPVERTRGIAAARAALADGALVVIPTDTVYGVAADAFDPAGVRRLLRAKGRSRSMPVPVLIDNRGTMRALADDPPPEALEIAKEFWPGGLSLICRQQPSLRWDLGDSRGTVMLRIPDQADARTLLADTGPLAVSSANVTGQPSATTVTEAVEMLGDEVEVYLDGGPTPGPVASTIVDATAPTLTVVREGVVTLAQLRAVVPAIQLSAELRERTEPGGDA